MVHSSALVSQAPCLLKYVSITAVNTALIWCGFVPLIMVNPARAASSKQAVEPLPLPATTPAAPNTADPDFFILPPVSPQTDPRLVPFDVQGPRQGSFDLYRLGPGDTIFVSVQRFPDLSGQVTIVSPE